MEQSIEIPVQSDQEKSNYAKMEKLTNDIQHFGKEK